MMLEMLKRRLPDADGDALLTDLLTAAEGAILAYTGRDALPEALKGAQLELAVVLYNRLGMEGESAHSEGSVARTAESLPELLRRQLNPYRLARGLMQ